MTLLSHSTVDMALLTTNCTRRRSAPCFSLVGKVSQRLPSERPSHTTMRGENELEDKMAAIKGGCMCGAVTYEVSGDPMFVGHCACENCQKATGAGHSSIAAFPEPSLKARGELASFAAKGDSGQATTYQFCPKCGSRLFIRAAM